MIKQAEEQERKDTCLPASYRGSTSIPCSSAHLAHHVKEHFMTKSLTFSWQETWKNHFNHWLAKYLLPTTYEAYEEFDWENAIAAIHNSTLIYPEYYTVPHHGMTEGYLSNRQAFAWELIERLFRIPHARTSLLQLAIADHPASIVDLGCGTATTSIKLAQMLSKAQLSLVDLSPHTLAAAQRQAQYASVAQRIRFIHAAAEHTGLESEKADLVIASLLFHELPQPVAWMIIEEIKRLLRPGGRVIFFDPIQCAFPWLWLDHAVNILLMKAMHEIYYINYMKDPLWIVCQRSGLREVERRLFTALPWIYQGVIAKK